RSKRAGFRFAITNDGGNNQVRIVEGGAIRVRQSVTQLTALVNRTWRLGCNMARHPPWETELLEQFPHPFLVLGKVGIHFAIRSLKIGVCHQSWPTVSRPGNVDHVQVVLPDDSIEVDVDEVQPWGSTPVTEQPRLDMILGQSLL